MNTPTPKPHVANIDFPIFYAPAFGNDDSKSRDFYKSLTQTPARVVLHQAARMVWLGDQIDQVARGRPALQILFLMIAAEAVAKLADSFEDEGQSRKYVKQFFLKICSDDHRVQLGRAFRGSAGWLTAEDAVDFLYVVRCDVAHWGKYFELHLPRPELDEKELIIRREETTLVATIPIGELRRIILEGAVLAARGLNQ